MAPPPQPLQARTLLAWLAGLLLAALVLVWAFPRAFPLLPQEWTLNRAEAQDKALALLGDLGEIPEDSLVVVRLATDQLLEARLTAAAAGKGGQAPAGEVSKPDPLAAGVLAWQVTVYPPKALSRGWSHRALLTPQGKMMELRVNPQAAVPGGFPGLGSPQATARAFLEGLGLDVSHFSIPEARSRDLPAGADLGLRYTARNPRFNGQSGSRVGTAAGLDVSFAGPRLLGFTTWYESSSSDADLQAQMQPGAVYHNLRAFAVLFFLPIVGVAFVRRYHAGELRIATGLRMFGVCLGAGLVGLLLVSGGLFEGVDLQIFSRVQMNWVMGAQLFVFLLFPIAVVSFLAWSVGESYCQQRWPQKLAAFEALIRGQWKNSTVATSALRGLVAGAVLLAGLFAGQALLRPLGAWAPMERMLDWSIHAPWPGLAHLALGLSSSLCKEPVLLLFCLAGLSMWTSRRWAIVATCAIGSVAFLSGLFVLPVSWGLVLNLASTAALIGLFLRYDLLTAMIASFLVSVGPAALAMVFTADPWLQLQGTIPLAAAALPLVVSGRWLFAGETFVYRYDEVPPHVRRIAERERQSLELETARSIQSSILPDLPGSIGGVEIAHAYRPATEVGGDFYDVLPLKDGRLAVAVGDVAGHGVSSGLIMSMAKSALAVQVAYEPEVEEVFKTLNRMVYQSARRRLLATLCYLVLDQKRGRLVYASAGHVAPYLISAEGQVQALESASYPLGARTRLKIHRQEAQVATGDCIFLFSDGVVEARATGSDELYGFERLEASLEKNAGGNARSLLAGVLGDLAAFAGQGPREDDQTVLVLRVP